MNLILHIIIANSFLIWHSNSYVFIYFFSSTAHCIQHHSTIITSTLFGHICSHHQELTDANENAISQYTEYNIDTVGMILFDKQSYSKDLSISHHQHTNAQPIQPFIYINK
eukprot:109042_1